MEEERKRILVNDFFMTCKKEKGKTVDAKARNQQDSNSQILSLKNKGFEKVK